MKRATKQGFPLVEIMIVVAIIGLLQFPGTVYAVGKDLANRATVAASDLLNAMEGAGVTNRAARRPNVILVNTDDQGYGDLGCHGNPWIKTPHIDRLYQQGVRLTDFHASPICAPTRAAMMTGQFPLRLGVWSTIAGRENARAGEVMLPEVFAASGYRTALFGKWHLGDNYPFRPEDRGFEHVLWHK